MPAVPSYVPDSPPAKLWELLRRNRRFRRVVERMRVLQELCESGSPTERRASKDAGMRILRCIQDNGNRFACLALQWLAPQPLFVVREAVLDVVELSPSRKAAPLRFDRIGRGITPNPSDPTWKWFVSKPGARGSASSKANAAGSPYRWGPEITTTISKDDRIKRRFPDEVTAWREWFATHTFTVDTPWNHAPPDFQRRWEGLWNKQTGTHQAAFETNFFQGWSLPGFVERSQGKIKAANQCIRNLIDDLDNVREGRPEKVCPPLPTRGGNSLRQIPQFTLPLSEVENTRMIQFSMFAGQRVFVLPQLTSKQVAEEVLKHLASEVLKSLPKVHEMLGTPRAWEVFVGMECHQNPESLDRSHALREYVRAQLIAGRLPGFALTKTERERWIRNGRLAPHETGATRSDRRVRQKLLRSLNAAYGQARKSNRHFNRWVEFLDLLTGATFPRLNLTTLGRQNPS